MGWMIWGYEFLNWAFWVVVFPDLGISESLYLLQNVLVSEFVVFR